MEDDCFSALLHRAFDIHKEPTYFLLAGLFRVWLFEQTGTAVLAYLVRPPDSLQNEVECDGKTRDP